MERFDVKFLPEAKEFLRSIEQKAVAKVLRDIRVARTQINPDLLKKLDGNIWEFRTEYSGQQYRLLAFWDKREAAGTLVVATHGIIKKSDKMPRREIDRAERIRQQYFD